MYASTKSFMRIFTESVALELRKKNVRIAVTCPGYVHTNFHNGDETRDFNRSAVPSYFWMHPNDVVEDTINGVIDDRVVLVPGFNNQLLKWLITNPLTRELAMNKTISNVKMTSLMM